jgi:hypothetical protein
LALCEVLKALQIELRALKLRRVLSALSVA